MLKIPTSIKFSALSFFLILSSFVQQPTNADAQTPTNDTPAINMEKLSIPPEIQEQIKKMQEAFLEEKLKAALQSFDQIEFVIEHLAQVINNNQLHKIDTKKVLNHLKNLRLTIQEIKKGSYIVVDPYSIKALLAIAQTFTEHIRAIVKNGLQTFPELDLENSIKRSLASDEIDFEQLEKQVITNQKNLEYLDKESQTVGLSLFNRMYRRIEKFSSDHNIIMRTGLALFGGLVTYYLISNLNSIKIKKLEQTSSDSISNSMLALNKKNPSDFDFYTYSEFSNLPQNLKQQVVDKNNLTKLDLFRIWLGNAPEYNIQGGLDKKSENYMQTAGWMQHYAKKIGLASLVMTPLIGWETLTKPFENNWKEFKLWTKKRWEGIRSYLRGGPLQKKVEYWKKEPKATFDDIIGKEHIKQSFQVLIDYISDPERFDRAGMTPSPGYLLYGSPGSGKTYLVEALAGEIKKALTLKGLGDKFNFVSFNAADVSQFGLETIIMLAKENAPCIVFIDEIHLCGWQNERDGKGLAEALTALSGCMNISQDTSKTVIIIGATNNPENIDKALKRRGRFGKHLYSDYPSYIDRFNYLKRELDNRGIINIELAYLEKLAKETERCTFEDLKAILISAMQKAKGRGQILAEKHLEEAFDEEIRHIIADDFKLPDDQKQILAVHQAGHALASLIFDDQPRVTKVTIRPINLEIREESIFAKYTSNGNEKPKPKEHIEYGKVFSLNPQDNTAVKTHAMLVSEMKILLAGHIAEKIVFGSSGYTYHKDEKTRAHDIAKFIAFESIYEKDLPKAKRNELNEKAFALLAACELEVGQILLAQKNVIEAIANALQEKLTLSSVELLEILKDQESVQEEKEE